MLGTIEQIRSWVFDDALPFWADSGVDRRYGGFVETLDFAGNDSALPFKRVRVACRQIYVFSHAKMLGFEEGEGLIAPGVEYLIERAWRAEGGFARRLTRDGALLDPIADLYDNAFALFALAWAYKATGDAQYRDWARKTLAWITSHMRHPSGEGFWHCLPATGLRQQNPHMHLLEACLVAAEAIGDDVFSDTAREMTQLFLSRFFDPETGTLGEFFNDDWSRASGEAGRAVEPGHQFEWIWILQNCRRLLGSDAAAPMGALARFSGQSGVNASTGAVMNKVRDDGAPIDAGSRTWPNTERLKAAVALYEHEGADPAPVIEKTGGVLLERYLTPHSGVTFPKGGWIDALDDKGAPIAEDMPASTLYHLMLAFAEVLRIRDKQN